MANGWTPERRARQAALIQQWQPWKKSTGPTSAEGKVRASRNANKGGVRPLLRDLARELREQDNVRRELIDGARSSNSCPSRISDVNSLSN